jgi:hypothetical protein
MLLLLLYYYILNSFLQVQLIKLDWTLLCWNAIRVSSADRWARSFCCHSAEILKIKKIYVFYHSLKLKCSLHNLIPLEQIQTDNINQMLTIADSILHKFL